MTAARDDAPLTLPDRDTARRMWDVLERARFNTTLPLQLADIAEKDIGSKTNEGRRHAVGLRRTASGGATETLTRLFLMGCTVPADQAERAVAPTGLDTWTRSGLLELAGGGVRAPVQLAPLRGKVFAADARWFPGIRPDHVMGHSGSTATLISLTLRRRVGALLDLGTGCGTHAILGAEHAGVAVGTDRNPRAVNMTAFNALLNGLENVEAVQGDLFQPVLGRRFDLIVSNPPYVISPECNFLYRDAGRTGDDLLHELLRDAPAVMAEGGICEMNCAWAHRRGEDWRERLTGWAGGNGCDVWVMQVRTSTPATYAEMWAGGEYETPEEWAARMDRWAAYFEEIGVEEISYGFIIMRRRPSGGPNWVFIDEAPEVGADVTESVERGFALRDWLAGRSDEMLLASTLRIAPELRWSQELTPTDEGWSISGSQVRICRGLVFRGEANQYVMGLLDRCRGNNTLGEALADLEVALKQELDREPALRVVRELVAQSFLVPVEIVSPRPE